MATVQKPEVSDREKEAFVKLAGADGEIDAFELRDILNKEFSKDFKFDEFTTDLTRSMVAMRDLDMSGKLDFEDYKRLWSDLLLCKRAFTALDSDNSGHFNKTEFHRALDILGLKVSESTEKSLVVRYSNKAGNICFNDFVACYIKLKTMLKSFRVKDWYNQGSVEYQLDEFVQLCMYA
jgi:Ca2+-binding EF-hand superfamily protein